MNRLSISTLLILLSFQYLTAQDPLILFDEQHPNAKVIYEGGTDWNRPSVADYPIIGNYTPTHYSNGQLGIAPNKGFCDYIYVPTENKLEPGKQYSLKLSIRFDESYDDMSFYQDHFGIALTSYLYPNKFPSNWGLWRHTNESLGVFHGGEMITIEKEFRPLSTSKYIVLGVFRADELDHLTCFHCYYPFELYELNIVKSQNPERPCAYFGDAFKNEPQENFDKREFNVYFDSGSSEITRPYNNLLDSLALKLSNTKDLMLLSAHTDMSGNDNISLGYARNDAVRQALITRGIDPSRIKYYNYADNEAADFILSTDRRVEINLLKGNLFREHYSRALEAAQQDDYPTAHKIMVNDWLNSIPPKKALAAYYDCWGENKKALAFKEHLLSAIKAKLYKTNELGFKLDSLKMEWLKGRTLSAHLSMLRMPGTKNDCHYQVSNLRDSLLRNEADLIFENYGFPQKEKVGSRASEVVPEIILTSNHLTYLEKYLPFFKLACEEGKLKWPFYARLYDQISILKNGFQRYGTKMTDYYSGKPVPEFPLEDTAMVDEYRRQVKLAPFTKLMKEKVDLSQDNIDAELVGILNNVYKIDQHHRNRIDERDRNFKKWKTADSLNQITVKKILDERGWLGPEIVGKRGSTTLFLVIQHSDLETQVKYLPMLRGAVKEGRAAGQDLALLEDRVALGQGKKQIYGSQIFKDQDTGLHYVAPLENPEKVNMRRAEVGLDKIENYVRRWDIDWNDEKHKINTRR